MQLAALRRRIVAYPQGLVHVTSRRHWPCGRALAAQAGAKRARALWASGRISQLLGLLSCLHTRPSAQAVSRRRSLTADWLAGCFPFGVGEAVRATCSCLRTRRSGVTRALRMVQPCWRMCWARASLVRTCPSRRRSARAARAAGSSAAVSRSRSGTADDLTSERDVLAMVGVSDTEGWGGVAGGVNMLEQRLEWLGSRVGGAGDRGGRCQVN